MGNFASIEINKMWKNRRYVTVVVMITAFLILSFFITYYAPSDSDNLLLYYYHIFAINSKLLFPLAITALFGPMIISEYRNKTIKLLWGSQFDKKEVFLGKFLCGFIYFSVIFISLITIYMVISGIFFGKLSNIQTKTTIIYKSELIKRSVVILISELTYLFCFASFVCLISIITKNQVLTFAIAISIILLYSFVPIPSSISKYIFLNGGLLHTALALESFPYLDIFRTCLINITTMNIFLVLGVLISDKQQL